MLRRTAARAFGSSVVHEPRMPLPLHQTSRGQALSQLFSELQECLQSRVGCEEVGSELGADPATSRPHGARVQVTPTRALSRGMEFVLRGPRGQCRFLHPMTGWILVTVEEMAPGGPGPMRNEMISVHQDWARYRAILKSTSSEGRRSGFRFSSAPQLAARYYDFVA